MGNFICLLLAFLLAGSAASLGIASNKTPAAQAAATGKTNTGKKTFAPKLLADARKALAVMIKDARADKGLSPETARNKPFWQSVHLIAKSLNAADAGLGAKSNDFFKGIAEARRAEQQMKIAWQLTGSKNNEVVTNGKILERALLTLRTDFSKEAQRKKKGGELNALEQMEFAKIDADQGLFLGRVNTIEKEAEGNKALENGLREIQKLAERILKEPSTVDAYVAILHLMDQQIGLVRGYRYYLDKGLREDWFILMQMEANYESSYYAWETAAPFDWPSLDAGVDLGEGADVGANEALSEEEINRQNSFAANDSFDMSEAEEDEAAASLATYRQGVRHHEKSEKDESGREGD